MQIIADTLSQATVGEPVNFGNLTMFPLLNGGEEAADYLTLDDAIKQGLAIVTEVSESGSVPELSFTNKAGLPVLLVDGEELTGAKQNRILNLTILAPAHRKLNIPVSCVERGRWSYRSKAFDSAPRAQFAASRANRVASVSYSLRESGRRNSDQSEVWEDIDRMAADLKVASETSAMSDIYQSYSSNLDECVQKLSPVKAQVGAAFAINGEIIGFDVFDRASTLTKLLPKLVSSYAIQALSRGTAKVVEAPREESVRELLNAVSNAEGRSFSATGEGEDVRIEEAGLSAAALVAKGRLIHLCGFRVKTAQ
jgi:ARG and Rhodanese-Phosphatase-superfamily-associated Protein domain